MGVMAVNLRRDEMMMYKNRVVWAKFGKVPWPCLLVEVTCKKYIVYCKSDDADLSTRIVSPFMENDIKSWKTKAQQLLRKKKETFLTWLEDLEWAKTKHSECLLDSTTCVSDSETTSSVPDSETTSSVPDSESTTSVPDSETTSSVPDSETTSSVPDSESATSVPDSETTSSVPDSETTSSVPDLETTSSVPDSETTTSVPDSETTSSVPDSETTSSVPDSETTSSVPDSETTSSVPDSETTSSVPDSEINSNLSCVKESDTTTSVSDTRNTSFVPDSETTSSVPDSESTTSVPDSETTSSVPDSETTSSVPEFETTSSVPDSEINSNLSCVKESDIVTSVSDTRNTTCAPNSETSTCVPDSETSIYALDPDTIICVPDSKAHIIVGNLETTSSVPDSKTNNFVLYSGTNTCVSDSETISRLPDPNICEPDSQSKFIEEKEDVELKSSVVKYEFFSKEELDLIFHVMKDGTFSNEKMVEACQSSQMEVPFTEANGENDCVASAAADDDQDYVPDSHSESEEDIEQLDANIIDEISVDPEVEFPTLSCMEVSSLDCDRDENKKVSCNHDPLDDTFVERDMKNPQIYIRKQIFSKVSATGRQKVTDRVWNNFHCCFVCKKLVTNIIKHLLTHKENEETRQLISLKSSSKDEDKARGKALQTILRNKGDHEHNMNVKQVGGELIIARKTNQFKSEDYGPCPKCLEWIKLYCYNSRHQSSCPANKGGEKNMTRGEAILNSSVILGDVSKTASNKLVEEVYPIMTRDEITECAKSDPIIVALGNNWLQRNLGNRLKRKYYTSSRMRGAARLLQHLRSLTKTNLTLNEYLTPAYFDHTCEAALLCAHMEKDDVEDLKSPSSALKIGFDIGRMSSIKLGMALRFGNQNQKKEAEEFSSLMKMEWSVRVSRMAYLQLQEGQFKKPQKSLPIPEDLSILGGRVAAELKSMIFQKNFDTYRRAVMLVETRLLTYNKRRSGELEALSLENYKMRSKGLDEADRALLGSDLSEVEKYLVESQELIKIRGKNGKTVPILVPEDVMKALEFITSPDVRRKVGVKSWNDYVFANTVDVCSWGFFVINSMSKIVSHSLQGIKLGFLTAQHDDRTYSCEGVIRAYDSLKTICGELTLSAPERITSVTMRKYIATLSQVIDMKDYELEWLCKHLGHTAAIHKLHYRSTSGFIERVNIGKLMLLQDLNLAGKYAGQRLQDIDLTEAINCIGENPLNQPDHGTVNNHDNKEFNPDIVEDFLEDEYEPKRKKAKCTRQAWTAFEEEELLNLFKGNFKANKIPVQKECMRAIGQSRKSKGAIHLRNWETIKQKVWRMIQRNSKMKL